MSLLPKIHLLRLRAGCWVKEAGRIACPQHHLVWLLWIKCDRPLPWLLSLLSEVEVDTWQNSRQEEGVIYWRADKKGGREEKIFPKGKPLALIFPCRWATTAVLQPGNDKHTAGSYMLPLVQKNQRKSVSRKQSALGWLCWAADIMAEPCACRKKKRRNPCVLKPQ